MIVYLDNVGSVISLDDIKRKYGKRGLSKFKKWMHGQTAPIIPISDIEIPSCDQWVYWDDYRRWATGLPCID